MGGCYQPAIDTDEATGNCKCIDFGVIDNKKREVISIDARLGGNQTFTKALRVVVYLGICDQVELGTDLPHEAAPDSFFVSRRHDLIGRLAQSWQIQSGMDGCGVCTGHYCASQQHCQYTAIHHFI